eukprot:scaffold34689_cov57-Phaeocystis_antarctica.AAC.1
MDPSGSGSKCPELAPSSLLSLIRSWGAPQAMGMSWKRPLSTHTVLGGTPGHGNELEAAVEHLDPETDGSMVVLVALRRDELLVVKGCRRACVATVAGVRCYGCRSASACRRR